MSRTPEQLQARIDEIQAYATEAFKGNQEFTFTLQDGDKGAKWMIGPYGTICIALDVHQDGKDDLFDAISVSLDGDIHFLAVASHAFATKFGLIYMDPHAAGFGANEGQIHFGQVAYEAKAVSDEARLRAKVVELTKEAASQVSSENAVKIATPATDIVGLDGNKL